MSKRLMKTKENISVINNFIDLNITSNIALNKAQINVANPKYEMWLDGDIDA